MKELYFFVLFSKLANIAAIVSVILLMALVIIWGIFFLVKAENVNVKVCSLIKPTKYMIFLLVFTSIIYIVVPNRKEMFLIYGLGSTIDYIQENKDIQNLPDKTIKALNDWVDELSEDKEKTD